jgi:hypothetical protein
MRGNNFPLRGARLRFLREWDAEENYADISGSKSKRGVRENER